MAELLTTVRRETDRLQKDIAKQTGKLQELERELDTHEKIAAILEETPTPPRKTRWRAAKKAKKRSGGRTDWNSLLEKLPDNFTAALLKLQIQLTKDLTRSPSGRWPAPA